MSGVTVAGAYCEAVLLAFLESKAFFAKSVLNGFKLSLFEVHLCPFQATCKLNKRDYPPSCRGLRLRGAYCEAVLLAFLESKAFFAKSVLNGFKLSLFEVHLCPFQATCKLNKRDYPPSCRGLRLRGAYCEAVLLAFLESKAFFAKSVLNGFKFSLFEVHLCPFQAAGKLNKRDYPVTN